MLQNKNKKIRFIIKINLAVILNKNLIKCLKYLTQIYCWSWKVTKAGVCVRTKVSQCGKTINPYLALEITNSHTAADL